MNSLPVKTIAWPYVLVKLFAVMVNGDKIASVTLISSGAAANAPVSGSPYAIVPSSATGAAASNYAIAYADGELTVSPAHLTITADSTTKILDAPNPNLNNVTYSGFVAGDTPASLGGTMNCTTTATTTSPVGSFPITCSGSTSTNYTISYVAGTLRILYAPAGTICDGAPSHIILPPISAAGTSVFKANQVVPAMFRVCDANGVSIGTPGVVTSFYLTQIVSGTVTTTVQDVAATNNPDTAFRWDSTNQQWIFNMSTKNLPAGSTYIYTITLNDGTTIQFQFGLD